MLNFKPLGDRALIRVLPDREVTKGNLFIPDTAKERPMEAEVLAVGRRNLGVEVGDHIYFGKYSGTEIELDGEKYLILKEDDILGKDTKSERSSS